MEDRDLARRMLAGEERAFEEFFDGHFPALYRFALARLGQDQDAAEEVAQATLCKAISKLHTYRGEAALLTWLCTFCRHEISAHHGRRGRLLTVDLPEEGWEIAAALDSLGPEQAVERSEIARLVHVVLDRLPPRYADALEWKYVDGLSVNEIAARTGTTPKAAESLLTRAREAFRDLYSALLPERRTQG
jgi:RNA polymerase sigma-70 factor (ECF subfamily)